MKDIFAIEAPASFGFSTGRSSAYGLFRVIRAYGGVDSKGNVDGSVLPPDFHVNLENTGHEREESLFFGHKIETNWNVKINWLEWFDEFDIFDYQRKDRSLKLKQAPTNPKLDPRFKLVDYHTAARYQKGNHNPHTPFMRMIVYYYYYKTVVVKLIFDELTEKLVHDPNNEKIKKRLSKLNPNPILPNIAQSICTGQLKIKTDVRFMQSLGYTRWNSITGIRYDEPRRYKDRLSAQAKGKEPFDSVMPLYEARLTQKDVKDFWAKQSLDLGIPSREGNCNLCFKKSYSNVVETMMRTDDFDDFWVWAEKFTGQVFRRGRPNYADTRKMIQENDPKLLKILGSNINDKAIDCFCGE